MSTEGVYVSTEGVYVSTEGVYVLTGGVYVSTGDADGVSTLMIFTSMVGVSAT